jgi:hypothetical protein
MLTHSDGHIPPPCSRARTGSRWPGPVERHVGAFNSHRDVAARAAGRVGGRVGGNGRQDGHHVLRQRRIHDSRPAARGSVAATAIQTRALVPLSRSAAAVVSSARGEAMVGAAALGGAEAVAGEVGAAGNVAQAATVSTGAEGRRMVIAGTSTWPI